MGDVSVVLLDLAAWIHAEIGRIDTGVLDDWGYAERTIRGSATVVSNHASGTAMDIDATLHPLGVRGTWTPAQKSKIHARLALYGGVIRWGEDYDDPAFGGVPGSRVDPMHWEINAPPAAVKQVADRIRAGSLTPTPQPRPRLLEDSMPTIVRCQPDKSKPDVWTAVLDAPFFVGMSTDGELASAAAMVKAGCPEMWVELATWQDYDARSHYVCGIGSSAPGAPKGVAPQALAGPATSVSLDVQSVAAAVADELAARLRKDPS